MAIVLIPLLLITGMAVGIWFLVKPQVQLPLGTERGELEKNGKFIAETMRNVQFSADGRTKEATVYGMGKDEVQVSHFNT